MLLDAQTPVVTVVGKTWPLHVTEVFQVSLEENLAMIADTVAYLKKHGREVLYDAEHFFDSFKEDPEYSLKTIQAATNAGADLVVLCETNGGALPDFVEEVTRQAVIATSVARSASTLTTTAESVWLTRWLPCKPGPARCRAPSMATASASATATSSPSCPPCS
jgi:hypothetical protein